jgi:hypothetical protein
VKWGFGRSRWRDGRYRVLLTELFSETQQFGFWVIIGLAVLHMNFSSIRLLPLLRRSNGETAIEYPLIKI